MRQLRTGVMDCSFTRHRKQCSVCNPVYVAPVRSGPREEWYVRMEYEEAAARQGLAGWQVNPYYCAGRVVVPALLDSLIC